MNNELYHYGVKGMKWGVITSKKPKRHSIKKANNQVNQEVRKRQQENKSDEKEYITKEQAYKISEDAIKAAYLNQQPLPVLSNQDIQDLNRRMELERKYSELHPDAIARGKKAMAGIVATTAATAAIISNIDRIIKALKPSTT